MSHPDHYLKRQQVPPTCRSANQPCTGEKGFSVQCLTPCRSVYGQKSVDVAPQKSEPLAFNENHYQDNNGEDLQAKPKRRSSDVNKVKELQRQESHSPVIVRRHAGKNCNRRTNHGDERRDGVRNISQMLREEKTEENSVDEKNNKEEEAARRPVSFSLDSGVVNKHKSLRLVKSAVSAESTELKKPCFLSSLCSSETKAIGNQPNQELAKDDICKESGIQVTRKEILDSPEKIADIKLKLENVKDLLDLTENQDREGIIAQRDVTGAELKMSSPKGDRKPFFAAAF